MDKQCPICQQTGYIVVRKHDIMYLHEKYDDRIRFCAIPVKLKGLRYVYEGDRIFLPVNSTGNNAGEFVYLKDWWVGFDGIEIEYYTKDGDEEETEFCEIYTGGMILVQKQDT